MTFFRIFTLLFFLILSLVCNGHSPFVIPVEQVFSFDAYPDANSRVSNELLQRISQGSGRLRAYTRFSMNGYLETFSDRKPGGTELTINLTRVTYTGDVIYRDFSLERILLPNRVDMYVRIFDEAGRLLSDTLVKEAKVPANGGNLLSLYVPLENNVKISSLKISPVRFYYTEEAFERFNGWFNALEQYYGAGESLEKAIAIIEDINPYDAEALLQSEFALCQAENLFNNVKYAGFHNWIKLDSTDPESLMESLDYLQKTLIPLRDEFNIAVASIDSLYYVSAIRDLDEANHVKAREKLIRSLAYNPFYIPSNLAIASIDLHNGNKESAIKRAGNVLKIMYPSGALKIQAHQVAKDILDTFFDEARELTWEHRYLTALKTLEPVEEFCKQVEDYYNCPWELEFRITASHMGMYRSFLTVSARARTGNNLGYAEEFINSALEYQQKNSKYVKDASEAIEQMQMVHNQYVENGIRNLASEQYQLAVSQLSKAREMCLQYSGLKCFPDTDHYLAEAERLKEIPVAEDIKERFDLHAESNNPEDAVNAGIRDQILEMLSYGHLKAWAGEIAEAQNTLNNLISKSLDYHLQDDPFIKERTESLSHRIIEKECELSEREFNHQVKESFRLKEKSEISRAAESARKVMDLLNSMGHCNFKIAPNDTLVAIKDLVMVAHYLEMIQDAWLVYDNAEGEDFDEFFGKYIKAEIYFDDHELSEKGVHHETFSSVIGKTQDMQLANAAIVFLTQWPEQYVNHITILLENLRLKGVRMDDVKKAQEAAGHMLATEFTDHPLIDAEYQVGQIIKLGGGWYTYLENAFRRYRQ